MLEVTKKKLFQFQSILKTSQNLEKIKGIPKTKNIMSGVSKIFKVNEIKKKNPMFIKGYLKYITLLMNFTLRKEMLQRYLLVGVKKKDIYGRGEAENFSPIVLHSTRSKKKELSKCFHC